MQGEGRDPGVSQKACGGNAAPGEGEQTGAGGGGSLGMEALGGGLGGGQAWATSPHVEELRLRPLKNSEHKQGMAGIWKDHGSLKFRGC